MKPRRVVDEALLETVRNQPCAATGLPPPSDPHHVTTRGARGGDTADNVMPLCRQVHREWDAPFKGPSWCLDRYPRIRAWLIEHGRIDVIERIEGRRRG